MPTILDCYTDEPSGLGVPPYLGVYPRYVYGRLVYDKPKYLTIDDLRNTQPRKQLKHKTDIAVKNLTRSQEETLKILDETRTLYIIAGVHTPGKYLSAIPGSLGELNRLLSTLKCEKVLVGPAAKGTQLHGGKRPETGLELFDRVESVEENYTKINNYAVDGARVAKQIPYPVIAEIETGRGCPRREHCSFCMEGMKRLEHRDSREILNELGALKEHGIQNIRFGRQSCFYSYKGCRPNETEKLLKGASRLGFKVIHIDNANPAIVDTSKGERITELIVEYCTPGNVAAFGVESFDENVQIDNCLNTDSNTVFEAVKQINRLGGERGDNGMPKFLPGINILHGLRGETKKTHDENMKWLKKMLDEDLMLRRINIRQVVRFPGTPLGDNPPKLKTRRYYYSWRRQIRTEIDHEMLKRVAPVGTIIRDVRMEVKDGKNTFGRQFGSYPLIAGVKQELELGKPYSLEVTGHMLRSLVCQPCNP